MGDWVVPSVTKGMSGWGDQSNGLVKLHRSRSMGFDLYDATIDAITNVYKINSASIPT
jgi:hypothetical protein